MSGIIGKAWLCRRQHSQCTREIRWLGEKEGPTAPHSHTRALGERRVPNDRKPGDELAARRATASRDQPLSARRQESRIDAAQGHQTKASLVRCRHGHAKALNLFERIGSANCGDVAQPLEDPRFTQPRCGQRMGAKRAKVEFGRDDSARRQALEDATGDRRSGHVRVGSLPSPQSNERHHRDDKRRHHHDPAPPEYASPLCDHAGLITRIARPGAGRSATLPRRRAPSVRTAIEPSPDCTSGPRRPRKREDRNKYEDDERHLSTGDVSEDLVKPIAHGGYSVLQPGKDVASQHHGDPPHTARTAPRRTSLRGDSAVRSPP